MWVIRFREIQRIVNKDVVVGRFEIQCESTEIATKAIADTCKIEGNTRIELLEVRKVDAGS